MWFFDTHDHGCMDIDHGDGCVEPVQINWFE